MRLGLKFSILLLLTAFLSINAEGIEPSTIHTDIYRRIVPQIAGKEKTLPKFEVCLRHYLSGQCLTDRPRFFSCDNPDINKYISCISDPELNKKISAAYDKMYAAAKTDIERIKKNKSLDPAIKQVMLQEMQSTLDKYAEEGKNENSKLKQIDGVINTSNRHEVADLLKSPDFLQKLNSACEVNPGACLSVHEYKSRGKDLLKNFSKEFNKLDAKLKKEQGYGLDEMLNSEMSLIKKCRVENLSKSPSNFCKSFGPDPVIIKAVSEEISKGMCDHVQGAAGLDTKTMKRLNLLCQEYSHYIQSLDKPSLATKGASSEKKAGSTSGNGWEGGKTDGLTTNREGLFNDWFSGHIKEEKYKCDKVESEITEICEDERLLPVVDKNVMDLVEHTKVASKSCLKELDPYHKVQIDAAGYMLEIQFRAYVDRLNFDKSLTPQKYQEYLEKFVSSCPVPEKNENECDYEGVIRKQTNEYVKNMAAEALIQREKTGISSHLSDAYLKDTVKAAQDLVEIDSTIKDLLGNFPALKGSLKDIWPDMFPCHSVVGMIDEVTNLWDNTHYNSRCAPLEASQNLAVQENEEELYQQFKALELGLVPGKTILDMPADKLAEYRKLRKERGIANDLDKLTSEGKILNDKKSSSMFSGQSTPTGRMIVEANTLTGLESRKLECKKKADQVKKLLSMKMSVLANYPQLASKTFKDGVKPSKEWYFMDQNCRGNKKNVQVCSAYGRCTTSIRAGCEKVPSDWQRQEMPAQLYEQLGHDDKKYEDKISKQLSVAESKEDLDSLKKAAGDICKDPLTAGADIIKDDRLYTMYASCALQNVQNGERRVASDIDKYQFWKPINNSADSRAICARRATESKNRCFIVQHMNSGLSATFGKGASAAASPLINGLDFVGCMAMFTGVGGAVYSGVKAGVQAGVTAGVKAGAQSVGRHVIESGRSLGSAAGIGLTAGGVGLSYHYEKVAEQDYIKVKAKQAAGLASMEDVEAASKAVEQTKLSNNLRLMLMGAFVPSGKLQHKRPVIQRSLVTEVQTDVPGFSKGIISRKIDELDDYAEYVVENPATTGKSYKNSAQDDYYAEYMVESPDVTLRTSESSVKRPVSVSDADDYSEYVVESLEVPGRTAETSVKRRGPMNEESVLELTELIEVNPFEKTVLAPIRKHNDTTEKYIGFDDTLLSDKPLPSAQSITLSESTTKGNVRPTVSLKDDNTSIIKYSKKTSETIALDDSDLSLMMVADDRKFENVVTIKSIDAENVVAANFGRCCTGPHTDGLAEVRRDLKNILGSKDEYPYFVGTLRRPGSELIRREKLAGYKYEFPRKSMTIDFEKEFPGLDKFSLRTFEMDKRGKLTDRSKAEAIDYINKNFPDADKYQIDFLTQGGFNAVFKACPKLGGKCKAIKLPGFDANAVNGVKESMAVLEVLDTKMNTLRKKMFSSENISESEVSGLRQDFMRLTNEHHSLENELRKRRKKLQSSLENYKMDLTLVAWGDELLAPGKGPKLDGKEFMSHAAIDRNPALLKKGIVVQDFIGLVNPPDFAIHSKNFSGVLGKVPVGSPEYQIIRYFSRPNELTADAKNLLQFSELCARATMLAVRAYCKSVREANNFPGPKEFRRMTQSALQFFHDTHEIIGESVYTHFGIQRGNPVKIRNPQLIKGRIHGDYSYATVGFDPLGGSNILWDPSTGKFALPDR